MCISFSRWLSIAKSVLISGPEDTIPSGPMWIVRYVLLYRHSNSTVGYHVSYGHSNNNVSYHWRHVGYVIRS